MEKLRDCMICDLTFKYENEEDLVCDECLSARHAIAKMVSTLDATESMPGQQHDRQRI
jgi:uncharacterized Zn ribbon protein